MSLPASTLERSTLFAQISELRTPKAHRMSLTAERSTQPPDHHSPEVARDTTGQMTQRVDGEVRHRQPGDAAQQSNNPIHGQFTIKVLEVPLSVLTVQKRYSP